jgi:type VI protein secretion system component VasK
MSPILLSQVTLATGPVFLSWHTDSALLEWIIILGAIGLVTLLALGWAAFFRRRSRRRHSHHHGHRHSSQPTDTEVASNEADASAPREKRRHRRRSHHRYLPRNPTLAETGGLPPIRPEDPPEPKP